ncbi:MAG: L-aspartate oxidase [Thermoanaerobaculaceae bacterium]
MRLADRERCQVLVLGTGVAGLSAALSAAEAGAEVLLVCRDPRPLHDQHLAGPRAGSSSAARRTPRRCWPRTSSPRGPTTGTRWGAHFLASEGPRAVQEWLLDRLQVPFDRRPDGSLDLALEGAHSVPRVLHAEDHTGAAIEDALLAAARAHPGIRLETTYQAVDLLTTHHHSRRAKDRYALDNRCIGAYLLEVTTGRVCTVLAAATVLATGGAGALYIHTSNHPGSIGSGLAMASRAGARLLNLEFIQFHPTCLFLRGAPRFLITEALRGAGALLVNASGERFMQRRHPRGELAPRDVVARGIIDEMHRTDTECMFLDLGDNGAELAERFPTVAATCARYGIDMRRERIPVVPASHYQCGGVVSDLRGRTTIPGLYAAGEGGVHRGARRQPARLHVAARGPHLRARGGPGRRRAGPRRPRLRQPRGGDRRLAAGDRPLQRGPRADRPGLVGDPPHDVELRRNRTYA